MDQIFISYRRDGGEAMAQLFFDRLSSRGFSVFYDIESLKSGPFDTKIYSKIEECEDVIVVLPPQALDRCVYDEDWVRNEIRYALSLGKNVIPIMLRGFVFPEQLPADIAAIKNANGIVFENMEYLDAKIDKLVSMCVSRPTGEGGSKPHVSSNADYVPTIITLLTSIGSNNPNNCWPTGSYSSVMDIDKFSVIYFQANLSNIPKGTGCISKDIKIYNSAGNLVFYDKSNLDWQDDWDKLSTGWIIRGNDGTSVPLGKYRAELRVNDSGAYSYPFEIVSGKQKKRGLLSFLFK